MQEAAHITASWPDLLTRPIHDKAELMVVEQGINALTEAPRKPWVMARVAALLSQYYAADVPPAVVKIMAEDWAVELEQWPEWAIEKAVRWWKSADNPDRKRRPLEGDISARAAHEFGVVKVAKLAVRRFNNGTMPYVAQDKRPKHKADPEAAKRILDEVGFNVNRFGGRND